MPAPASWGRWRRQSGQQAVVTRTGTGGRRTTWRCRDWGGTRRGWSSSAAPSAPGPPSASPPRHPSRPGPGHVATGAGSTCTRVNTGPGSTPLHRLKPRPPAGPDSTPLPAPPFRSMRAPPPEPTAALPRARRCGVSGWRSKAHGDSDCQRRTATLIVKGGWRSQVHGMAEVLSPRPPRSAQELVGGDPIFLWACATAAIRAGVGGRWPYLFMGLRDRRDPHCDRICDPGDSD